jgi:predicted nucleic acid-binding protein
MGLSIPPMPVVVDASFAIAGLMGDQAVQAAWERWAGEGRMLLAPAIVWPEIGNALLVRHKFPLAEVTANLQAVELAGLETADRGPQGVQFALDLAARHRLSVYDATYLWLAIDIDGELATQDRALARAAVAEGVPLAPEATAS